MYASQSYGERYYQEYGSENGVLWRLAIDVAGWSGESVQITEYVTPGHVAVRWSVPSPSNVAGVLASVAPSLCRIQLLPQAQDPRDGVVDMFGLRGLPDGHVRVRLSADLDGSEAYATSYFTGYVLPERFSDVPANDLSLVEMQAAGGLHLTVKRAVLDPTAAGYDADAETPLVDWLRGMLAELSGATDGPDTLVTRVDWRPFLADSEVLGTVDPMAAIRLRAGAFATDEKGFAQDVALRGICARMLARLFQAPGGEWHVVQRGLLAQTAGESVPTFTYNLAGTDADAAPGTRTTPTPIRDTINHERGLYGALVSRSVVRSGGLGVNQVQSDYDFRPDLENVIVNGSFESGVPSPDSWTGTGTTVGIGPGQASTTNARRLSVYDPGWDGTGTEPSRNYAEQDGLVYVAGHPDMSLELSFAVIDGLYDETADSVTPMQWRLAIGAHPMRVEPVVAAGNALRGTNARIPIEPLFSGVSGAVDGTPILAEGTTVAFGDPALADTPTVRLRRPAKVGDIELFGDLSDSIAGTETADAWYFADAAGDVTTDVFDIALPDLGAPALFRHTTDVRAAARLITPSGVRVAGFVRTAIFGSLTVNGTPGGGLVDLVTGAITANGNTAGSYGRRASLTAGLGGALAAALPETDAGGHLFGDGPLPDTETRLRVLADDGNVYDTQQGEDTGWISGTHGSTTTGRNIDGLAAVSGLSQLAGRTAEPGGPERWGGVLYLPHVSQAASLDDGASDCLFWPQDVYRLYQPCSLVYSATAGAGSVSLSAAAKPGQPIVVGDGATEETHYAGAVALGVGVYVVTLVDAAGDPATLAYSHAVGTSCLYGFPAFWDVAEIDTGAGAVSLEATDLAWREGDYIEEITLQ